MIPCLPSCVIGIIGKNGDYVSPLVSVDGQFTVGKDYQIKWIDWDDVVYVDDDGGKENGWHVSQCKFVKEGG